LSLFSRFRSEPADTPPGAQRGRLRSVLGHALSVIAAVLIYLALIVPETVARHKAGVDVPVAFLRLPIEAIFAGAVVLTVPARLRRPVAVLFGLGIGSIAVLKVVNMGFRIVLGRRFNPVLDMPLFADGYRALVETDGWLTADLAVAGALLLTGTLLVVLTLATVRLAGVVARHARPARRTMVGLTAAWVALAISGVTFFPNYPVASDTAAALAKTTMRQVPAALRDQQQFASAARDDPYRHTAPADLVAGLTGKDVVVGVVESYGRAVVTDPSMAAVVDPVLDAGTASLAAAGYHAKTGFLTSSTYGGGSWLAHASFQSGLWITNQQRYHQLTAGDRITLTSAFHDAGWQTVGIEPGNTVAWPEKDFYGYDTVYDSRNMGYQGPRFGWSRMPDQYTLAEFQREVYAKKQRPLMAELTLTSSHEPWTPIPEMVDWDQIGDGSVYAPMAAGSEARGELWKDPAKTRIEYAKSIAYSVNSLVSWVEKYGDDNLVLIMFGDHQPMSIVSGANATHDVPITIVAHDPAVFDRIAGWDWTDGLKPGQDAPVWRMDQFRDKFFDAYSKQNTVALSHPH
jgi:hypothetical protein